MNELNRETGAPLPERGQERWWPVWGVQGHYPSRVGILSDYWWGQWFHFFGVEPYPCEMHPGCQLCGRGAPNRWCGYVAALAGNNKTEVVFGITANAAHMLKPTLEKRGSLRGLDVTFQRRKPKEGKKPKKNDPVLVTINAIASEEKLRGAFPVLPSLHKLWGLQSVRRGERRPTAFTAPPVVTEASFDYASIPDARDIPY